MLSTYRAILKGDKVVWLDKPPAQLDGVEVRITLIKEGTQTPLSERSKAVAELLSRLAQLNPFRDIEDPAQWQREIRQERYLPNRNEP